ncbi:MAG: YqgE/AlgH family protein [Betaproteobacteria bacterium]|nr:MAG: YqgE/AlgH family protein [Betaproteobacteria bacterium]
MQGSCLAGHFLIAMPAMEDPNFKGTVTYICEHSEQGALGVVVNRQTNLTMATLFDQIEVSSPDVAINARKVHFGGPVSVEHGFVLHRSHGNWNSSIVVSDEMSLTTSKDILEALAVGNGPTDWLLTLGYAGWSAGQLEEEIVANAWLTVEASADLLFDTPCDALCDVAMQKLGISKFALSNIAGHA